jgi:hypothetical protein
MTRQFTFNSQLEIGSAIPDFSQEAVKNEPMFWRASASFASQRGGPITKAFLEAIDPPEDAIIDTRSHMLMKGWFPCIPGWHHDDVPRTRIDGQPNYEKPDYEAKHVMALINGEICPTEFAIGNCKMPQVPLGGTIYKQWHPEIENLIRTSRLKLIHAPSNRLVWFDWQSFHQGNRATASGWRWFGRATFGTDLKPMNEIRNQVQVYLEFPMEGW